MPAKEKRPRILTSVRPEDLATETDITDEKIRAALKEGQRERDAAQTATQSGQINPKLKFR